MSTKIDKNILNCGCKFVLYAQRRLAWVKTKTMLAIVSKTV